MAKDGHEPKRGLLAWCLYDWANSAFPAVITTFVFAAYFTKAVAPDEISGTAAWGWAMSASALAVAILGPVLGAIADHAGKRKPWLFCFTLLCAIASALLWTIEADTRFIFRALFLVALANFAFETGMVFYNAMLADLAPAKRVGRWSGWGWGLGYFGGLMCLAMTLIGFVQTEAPWFGLDKDTFQHLRVTGPLVGLWVLIFALPLFLWTPDKAGGVNITKATRRGIQTLIQTIRDIRKYGLIARFLVTRMIYTDGLNTLFAFGGIYAAGTFGFGFEDLILFGIAINVSAGLGAVGFAWIDDHIGPKRVILISLAALTALSGILLIVESVQTFWIVGVSLGIFVGPAQSASRSMMTRLAPDDLRGEMFGLYALSGKATAFLGPALLAAMTQMFESQRAGMASILIFFIAGLILMMRIPEPDR